MNFYEHHLGDYMRDTSHLSMLEEGAYRRLLDAYYVREKPLPGDLKYCCRLARAATRPECAAVATVLEEFFTLTDDCYRHKRCDAELAKVADKKRKAADSANARWTTFRSASGVSADAMRSQTDGNANSMHVQSEGKPNAVRTVCSPVPSPQSPCDALTGADVSDRSVTERRRSAKTRVPDNFGLTDELTDYVCRKLPDADPGGLFEKFVGHARAKGWAYVDWEQAFQTFVRNCAPNSGHWAAGQYPKRPNAIQWQ